MSTARTMVATIVPDACGIAARLASGSAKQPEALADAHQTGAPAWALRDISSDQASKSSESVNGVRPRIAILTRAQK
jgi:hypothetical protein